MADEEKRAAACAKARAVAEKLDEDLDEWMKEIQSKPPRRSEVEDMTIDEIAAELKSHPAFMKEFDPTKPLSPAMEGLMALKYESDSPESNAENFKDDGNDNFKKKRYKWARDNYSKGIELKCSSRELNAILYCNRAAANYHIGNIGSALKDAKFAKKFKPDHVKALVRGAQCCIDLKKYEQAVEWCEEGLKLNATDAQFIEMRQKADKLRRQQEKDRRKALLKEKKEREAQKVLIDKIKERGVTLALPSRDEDIEEGADPISLSTLESCHPSGGKVHVDDNGDLIWPVLFLYPEYGESDYISCFNENNRLIEHLELIFGAGVTSAPWDVDLKYTPEDIEVYFEEKEKEKLHRLDKKATLKSILADKRYVVQAGTPGFVLLVKKSKFAKDFVSKYET